MSMIDVKDIPADLMNRIREQFDVDPQIVRLRIRQHDLSLQGKFHEAMQVGKTINELFDRVVYQYLKEAEEQVEKIDINNMQMPIEDRESILAFGIVMFMACDIIESAILDTNDTLHKHDKELSFEMFNDIQQLSKMAKEKLKFLQNNSGYMNDLVWADKCDNIYQMMLSKAKSIMRKRKGKDWGKNMKIE